MGISYGSSVIEKILYDDGEILRVYRGSELFLGDPPVAPPIAPFTEMITIPAGVVGADLVRFPFFVDLANMSTDWWYNVAADGSDIRAYDVADAQIPFDLVAINKTTRTGALFIRTNLAAAAPTVLQLEVGYPVRTALPANDTYGSQAVWVDYEAVYLLTGNLNDRTAHARNLTVKTGAVSYSAAPFGAGGGITTAAASFQASVDNTVTPGAIYTLAASLTRDVDNSENQQALTFAQTYGGSTNRSTIGHRNSGDVWTTFSADDSWLDGPAVVLGQPHRVAATYNGATQRRLFLDGAVVATDNAIVTKTMDTLALGGGSAAAAYWRGRIGFAYLRLEVMSEAWLAAEAANLAGELGNPSVQSLWVGATT